MIIAVQCATPKSSAQQYSCRIKLKVKIEYAWGHCQCELKNINNWVLHGNEATQLASMSELQPSLPGGLSIGMKKCLVIVYWYSE